MSGASDELRAPVQGEGTLAGEGRATRPRPVLERVECLSNVRVTEGVGLMTLRAPRVASMAEPGTFVHLRIAEDTALLLRRPFSIHRACGDMIVLLYQVLGPGTRAMSLRGRGDVMDVIGPLGSGFGMPDHLSHALLVAGGLGAAPLGFLAERLAERGVAVTVAFGAPTAARLVARELFDSVARKVSLATDDGSEGRSGPVTDLVEDLIASDRPDRIYVCGPEAMACRVALQAAAAGVPCEVSLERLMACGVGACLSCVVSTTWGSRCACCDGPVFDAGEVQWEASETPPRN